jgi:hypothetical protein
VWGGPLLQSGFEREPITVSVVAPDRHDLGDTTTCADTLDVHDQVDRQGDGLAGAVMRETVLAVSTQCARRASACSAEFA